METEKPTALRHTQENKIVEQALAGDTTAANRMLKYLSSANPTLRQIMEETIYDLSDARIWNRLLRCLALQRWNNQTDCERRSDPIASERIDRAIIEMFKQDESDKDKNMKEAALLNGLKDSNPEISQTSAYLMGLRGDVRAIPVLKKTLETSSKDSQLRAIKALEALKDERCGPPLLDALVNEEGEIHREAGRALIRLGRRVEETWLQALDHPDQHIRWHAARGLGNTGDAQYADILAEGLLDENREVRWASADVLAHLGEAGVLVTLKILSQSRLNAQTLQAAYHALHDIASSEVQERLQPLLVALRGPAASIEAPAVAQRLLMEWEKTKS